MAQLIPFFKTASEDYGDALSRVAKREHPRIEMTEATVIEARPYLIEHETVYEPSDFSEVKPPALPPPLPAQTPAPTVIRTIFHEWHDRHRELGEAIKINGPDWVSPVAKFTHEIERNCRDEMLIAQARNTRLDAFAVRIPKDANGQMEAHRKFLTTWSLLGVAIGIHAGDVSQGGSPMTNINISSPPPLLLAAPQQHSIPELPAGDATGNGFTIGSGSGDMTLGRMRASGERDVVIHCHDQACNNAAHLNVDPFRDDIALSDLELYLHCTKCGLSGGDIRPMRWLADWGPKPTAKPWRGSY